MGINNDIESVEYCIFCGEMTENGGHNPAPVCVDEDARCCKKCNSEIVVPERNKRIFDGD